MTSVDRSRNYYYKNSYQSYPLLRVDVAQSRQRSGHVILWASHKAAVHTIIDESIISARNVR